MSTHSLTHGEVNRALDALIRKGALITPYFHAHTFPIKDTDIPVYWEVYLPRRTLLTALRNLRRRHIDLEYAAELYSGLTDHKNPEGRIMYEMDSRCLAHGISRGEFSLLESKLTELAA